MAAIMTWLAANQAWIIPVVGILLAAAGIKNTDAGQKVKDWLDGIFTKADTTAGGMKSGLDDAGNKLHAELESAWGKVLGVGGDIKATGLDIGTRAIWRQYMDTVPAEDQAAVTEHCQALLSINAKLPVMKPTA